MLSAHHVKHLLGSAHSVWRRDVLLTRDRIAKKSSHHQYCFNVSLDAIRAVTARMEAIISTMDMATMPGPLSGVPGGISRATMVIVSFT